MEIISDQFSVCKLYQDKTGVLLRIIKIPPTTQTRPRAHNSAQPSKNIRPILDADDTYQF